MTDGQGALIRALCREDIPGILEIEKRCFTTPWTAHAFRLELKNHLAVYRVAELDGRVAGYGGMWLIMDEAHITNVAIHPNHRRQRLGLQIMNELIRCAGERGMRRMTLEVRTGNEVARHLYARLGFLLGGIRPGYYQDTGEDALIMWKELTA